MSQLLWPPLLSALLHHELVHAAEGVWILQLERMPSLKIMHELAENILVPMLHLSSEFKPNEAQVIFGDEGLNLRNGRSGFLNMEQQITALAGGEKIARLRGLFEGRAQQLLPAAANVFRRWLKALLRNKSPGGDNMSPRELAVEADSNETARPEQRQQRSPARKRVGKVVQYPACIDQIERPAD